MIGERSPASGYPGAARAGTIRARRQLATDRRRPIAPAVEVRERLADALQHSVLVQLMLAMSCIALAAMLYLAQASQASVLQFNIADLQRTRTQLATQNANLEATATTLRAVERISTVALGPLHMTQPDFSNTIWIQPTIPPVEPLRPATTNVVSAQNQSRPAAWLTRFLRFLKNAL